MENGRSRVSFHSDPNLSSEQTSISFTLPPSEPGEDPKDNSIMIPPYHAHPKQPEIFTITKGTALFHFTRNQLAKAAGSEITIPPGEYHKFTNQSCTEPMTLEARYDPAELVREERFFRNLCGYLQDVTGGGVGMLESASIPQLALFAWEADMPICEPGKLPL
jgi:mannose-6-phosphate isomerase-like protein (cupin superfamily)